jgi:hypothetical protein
MKPLAQLLLLIFIFLSFSSCGPSLEEKAIEKLNEAKKLIAKGDTIKAIDVLKSLPTFFPKANIQIADAKKMKDELFSLMIDSRKERLSATEIQISKIEKNFTKEKTEFDVYTQYIPNTLSLNHSWNKSFLQVTLNELGEIFLTSNYMGKEWLNHTAIKVYDGGLQVKTPEVPSNDPNNRKCDFLDYKWEKVSYTDGKSDTTIRFISQHSDRNLKCVFMGANYYYIILEELNKEAIRDAYNLSVAIKNRDEIIKQIKQLETKREK